MLAETVYPVLLSALIITLAAVLVMLIICRRKAERYMEEQEKCRVSLEKALEEAKASSEAKSAFLSEMSHNIRTPLNAVLGMTEIALRHKNDPARVGDCLEKISLSGHYLAALINDIHDITLTDGDSVTFMPAHSGLEGKHILVAEDNELNWEILSDLLFTYGMTADRAQDGKICVEMLLSSPEGFYDMILMDIMMPVMNGKEAAKAIRKSGNEYVRNIPIIAVTADEFAGSFEECLAAGIDGHISKPVEVNDLFREMRRVLYKI